MTEAEARQLNPVSLAFLGDAVYTLFVRERLVRQFDLRSGGLHVMAAKYVCAAAQAEAYERLRGGFTPDEADISRRARNAHPGSHPRNAEIADYRKATAFEAVLGYLRLLGREERLASLMLAGMETVDKGENNE